MEFQTGEVEALRLSLGLPPSGSGTVYYCSNQMYKIDPDTFSIWCGPFNSAPCPFSPG